MIFKIFKLLTNPWKMVSVIADYLGCILPDKLFLSIKYKVYYARIQQASAKLRNVFVKALLWC